MNARQIKKKLKQKINMLEADNNLMRKIIADSSTMQELYDRFNKPVNVRHTTMEFQEYKVKRKLPLFIADKNDAMKYAKRALAQDILEGIKDNISYEVYDEYMTPTITASIFVGRKD